MDLIEQTKAAGVVGAGGAGFPTHIKLAACAEWFIVNAAECEPLIETDKFLCRTYPHEIVETAETVGKALGASHVVIALKEKYKEEISALQNAINNRQSAVRLHSMRPYFPAGDEFVLVEEVTKRVVPEGGLPLQVGAVVDNVGTIMSIFHALKGQPVTDKYLSVVGAVEKPVILHVPVGTSVLECIQAAKPSVSSYSVILGGPMMGKALRSEETVEKAVVTKTTGNIIVLPADHELMKKADLPIERIRTRAKSTCMQCRACTDLCPRNLLGHRIRPHFLMRNFAKEGLMETDEAYLKAFGEAVNCSSCGACEMFSCPMGLSPRQVNAYLKQQLREKQLRPERGSAPAAKTEKDSRRIPTNRLVARLGLSKYDLHINPECRAIAPQSVYIPFLQHIGKSAVPVKQRGDVVTKGELLAMATDGGPSANIHCSISGVIHEINENGALIRGREE
ncbi:4Fe-4S dicluster domain-containing protein [Anaerotruncus rubiinfantis]|uniref:4Fe-4S dicluster domain-containing protein n=1 Tax=Anaerotruncus rubiinfantis TaxID=1720200 RepID=UPI0008299116|nr:4Fe-4S dicluster domain-containing protein [Anaerotruncus rubiinfantis]